MAVKLLQPNFSHGGGKARSPTFSLTDYHVEHIAHFLQRRVVCVALGHDFCFEWQFGDHV